MPIQVQSEIGPLKRVLLHRPGLELEHLIPGSLERLLFDDIPYLRGAQAEHDCFAHLLRTHGAEVVYLSDLTAETIGMDQAVREAFVRDFIREAGMAALRYEAELFEYLMDIPNAKALVLKTMAGVSIEELSLKKGESLAALLHNESHFILDPIPNLYFTRDPFASIGTGVSLNRMYSITRNRETIFGRYILKYHPDYAGRVPFYYDPGEPFSLEGGDILNLSDNVLAVGVSQRTKPEAVEQLAKHIFQDETSTIKTVLAFDIPNMRAFMHLDTVFTQADRDKFIIHPEILQSLRLFALRKSGHGRLQVTELMSSLRETLAYYLGLDGVKLLYCGGQSRIAAAREQWNDGSNALCIAPGTVIAYDRNYITNEILEENGVTVLKTPSGELSRGRGGPRCMSMPLWRDPLVGR